ncbi:MAG: metallophosphoesterase [Gemmatimonadetes bacterium]|nr:metallophosphoesterase [Gemmatimonadota bacterium]
MRANRPRLRKALVARRPLRRFLPLAAARSWAWGELGPLGKSSDRLGLDGGRRTPRVGRAIAAAAWFVLAGACGGAEARPQPTALVPVATDIDATIWLLGDAGGSQPGDVVLAALARAVGEEPERSVVVFLGDNIYPRGMPDSGSLDYPEAVRRLDAQVAAGQAARLTMFVPGNHDWGKQGLDGWEVVRRQGRHLAARGDSSVVLLPPDGCPGPSVRDVGTRLRLVALDTQWWLHGGPRPEHPTSSCPADSPQEVADSLRSALATAGDRVSVVVAHHPLVSDGPHGGHFGWRDHLFPLRHLASRLWVPVPLVGSAYPAARRLGIVAQDRANPANRHMRATFEAAFAEHRPLIYASGHEHALEVYRWTSARYALVSGAGMFDHTDPVGRRDSTLFAAARSGYMRIDLTRAGRARLGVVAVDGPDRATEVFSLWLD